MTRLVDNTDDTESDVVVANPGDLHVRDGSTRLRQRHESTATEAKSIDLSKVRRFMAECYLKH